MAANNRPISVNSVTITDLKPTTKQLGPNPDERIDSASSNLDSLDLVTSIELENLSPLAAPNLKSTCDNDELCGNDVQLSHSTPKVGLSVPKSTIAHLTDSYPDIEVNKYNHNLRRHSQEDYDVDCDPTENYSDGSTTKSPAPISTAAVVIPPKLTLHSRTTPPSDSSVTMSPLQPSTIGESLRRMSESEEDISVECDSLEDLTASTAIIGSPLTSLTTSAPKIVESTGQTPVTDPMRRMSSSGQVTDCVPDENSAGKMFESFTTETVELTEPNTTTLSLTELSRRMSDTDIDCDNNSSSQTTYSLPKDNSMVPSGDLMRRMSESKETSSDCDSQEYLYGFIELTTAAPILSDSLRRMSSIEEFTTESNFEDSTEYVTECQTEVPLTSKPKSSDGTRKAVTSTVVNNTLECCPDSVCSLLYPSVPACDNSKIVRKLDELRNMFYLYKTQCLITEMQGQQSAVVVRKQKHERRLVDLWNAIRSEYKNNVIDGCANGSAIHNVKRTISSIYCVFAYTNNLLNDRVLQMIMNAVENIETTVPTNTILSYPILRRIIFQSIPKISNRSDQIHKLFNYMLYNRNYETERMFLLQLLQNVQQRFETNLAKYFINSVNSHKTTDPTQSLQENGVGVKMHRTLDEGQ